jgi:hypothetical protein
MCVTVFLFASIAARQIHDDGMAGCAVFVSGVVCSIFTIMTVSFLKKDY